MDGGPTEVDNLILLCQWHHTAVHESGMTIGPHGEGGEFGFGMPDGRPFEDWYHPQALPELLAAQLRWRRDRRREVLTGVTPSTIPPPARTIRPGGAGERFDLHAYGEALFGMRLPAERQYAASAAERSWRLTSPQDGSSVIQWGRPKRARQCLGRLTI